MSGGDERDLRPVPAIGIKDACRTRCATPAASACTADELMDRIATERLVRHLESLVSS